MNIWDVTRGVTWVSQVCYRDVTWTIKRANSGVKGRFRCVTGILQICYRGVI